MPLSPPTRSWTLESVSALEVPEASGLAWIGDGTFAVVDDGRGVYLSNGEGRARRALSRDDHPALRELEGACIGPDGSLWVLSERDGSVMSLAVKETGIGPPQTVGKLKRIGKKANKGWEGLDIRLTRDGTPEIVACHEGKPRRIGLFDAHSFEVLAVLKLPAEAKADLSDLSDLAVDPDNGHLWVVSDESRTLVELRLEDRTLTWLGTMSLDVGKAEKPEGLAFDPEGRLWLCTDGDPHLRRYRR